jgi:hypothetical protein
MIGIAIPPSNYQQIRPHWKKSNQQKPLQKVKKVNVQMMMKKA